MGEDTESRSIDEIQRLYGRSLRPEDVIAWANRDAGEGCSWVQFTYRGDTWKGAMLYLGDEPLAAQPVPALR